MFRVMQIQILWTFLLFNDIKIHIIFYNYYLSLSVKPYFKILIQSFLESFFLGKYNEGVRIYTLTLKKWYVVEVNWWQRK